MFLLCDFIIVNSFEHRTFD